MSIERQLREIIDSIPTLAWSAKADGAAEFFNRRWLEYTGLTLAEASGWGWSSALHPDDVSMLLVHWKGLLDSGETGEIEARLRRSDGEYRWFLFRASPVRDERGKISQWYGINTDIEDRKRAEEAQRLRDQEFHLIVDNMSGMLCSVSHSGEVEFANKLALDYFGKSAEELRRFDQLSAVHGDDIARARDDVKWALETGHRHEGEYRILGADGTYRWFNVCGMPFRDASGQLIRWFILLTNVDARKKVEEALRSSEARFRLLVDNIAGQIAVMTPDGEVEFVNRQTIEYFGKSLEELKGWMAGNAVHPEDLPSVVARWTHSVVTGDTYDVDHRLLRSDGIYRWFHARGYPVRDLQGQIISWYVLLTDIEERKQLEQKLIRSEGELLEAQRLSRTGSFRLDVPTGKVSVSPEIHRLYQAEPGDDTTSPDYWFDKIHHEDRQRVREYFESCLSQKKNYEADYRIVLSDGRVRYQHAVGHPVVSATGDLIEFLGTSTDVTELRWLERQLEHERDRLRLILDLNNRVASELDLKQLFEAMSTELRRVFKCDYVGIACPDESGEYLRQLVVDYPESKGVFREGGQYPVDASCSGVAVRTGKPFMIKDLSEGQPFWRRDETFSKAVATEPFKSGCFLPMIISGQTLGVLQVTSLKERAFTQDDLEFLDQVAAQIAITLKNALRFEKTSELKDRLHDENVALREEIDHTFMFEEIVGSSGALRAVLSNLVKVAPTDSTVLITGETGTGKELIARAIHRRSRRAERAFVSVNCASIPSSLIASELFGHEKGAFTGALQQRQGRFELARGGTIFLDEVGELPAETQIALLRVLQERQFERVGGSRVISADVRVIAATNRNLLTAIEAQQFRADLFYRLNVFPIQMPPLRARKEDLPMLLEYFVKRFSSAMGKTIRTIDKHTFELCQHYDWPGNIRELQNIVERSVILCEGEIFSIDDSWLAPDRRLKPDIVGPLRETLYEREKKIIEDALIASKGKIAGPNGAAAKLGIPASTLDSKIKQFRIHRAELIGKDQDNT